MSSWYKVQLAYQTRLGVVHIEKLLKATTKDSAENLALEAHGVSGERLHLIATVRVLSTSVSERTVKKLMVARTLNEVKLT